MGYRYGEHRYTEGRYSRWADWWHDRTCEEEEWVEPVCAEKPWTDAEPEPPYFPLLWAPVPAIDTAWEGKPADPYNPWAPVGEPPPLPRPLPPPVIEPESYRVKRR